MISLLTQFADLLINGSAYILAVLIGTSTTNSIFTNFNFFTTVNSQDNPFLNILMQGMVGNQAGQWGEFIYRLAFILFGALAAAQIFKSFINPASRGNASPSRTIMWIITAGFLMIFGQKLLSVVLEAFTGLIQGNMKAVFDLKNLDDEANIMNQYDLLAYMNHLNRFGAALVCACGVGASLLAATITYLERYLSFAVTAYLGPFAMAMTACDDTRRSSVQWLQSFISQMLGIVLSLMFLYMGAQALTMSDSFLGGSGSRTSDMFLTGDSERLSLIILRSVGATVFFSLSRGTEKFLGAFGIQTMHLGDAAQAVAQGTRTAGAALKAGMIAEQAGKKAIDTSGSIAAKTGLLNHLKPSSAELERGGVKARMTNAFLDNANKKYKGASTSGGIRRDANGKMSFVTPTGATKQDKKILSGLNNGAVQQAVHDGGLLKKADGTPVNDSAAKTLSKYGVNNANDLACVMYGDKAFKNGESYQMASMAKGDKTGAQYMVLSGVDQNGNLVSNAARVPDRTTSRLDEKTENALHESSKPYSASEQKTLGTTARDPREKALMDAGYSDGYKGLANSTLKPEEAAKFSEISSASLSDDDMLTFIGKDKDGAKVEASASTRYAPDAPNSRLSSAAQEALHADAEPYSPEDRRNFNTKARDEREFQLMNAGYEDGYRGLAQSMLGEHEASKYASVDSATLSSDGKLTFEGTAKDGGKLSSTVDTSGSNSFAPDGEHLLNAQNKPIAEIDKHGNVSPYNTVGEGMDISHIPVDTTYTPNVPHRAHFASATGSHEIPALEGDLSSLINKPEDVGKQFAGFTYDKKHGTFHGPAAFGDGALQLFDEARDNQEERKASIGTIDINASALRGLQPAPGEDVSLVPVACGTLTNAATGHQQNVYAWMTGQDTVQLGIKDESHNSTNSAMYAVTREEAAELADAEYQARNDKANRKKDAKSKKESSDDSDEASA